jgi:hypothetical protein
MHHISTDIENLHNCFTQDWLPYCLIFDWYHIIVRFKHKLNWYISCTYISQIEYESERCICYGTNSSYLLLLSHMLEGKGSVLSLCTRRGGYCSLSQLKIELYELTNMPNMVPRSSKLRKDWRKVVCMLAILHLK